MRSSGEPWKRERKSKQAKSGGQSILGRGTVWAKPKRLVAARKGEHPCCTGQQLLGPKSKEKPGAGVRAAGGQDQMCILQRSPWLPWGEGTKVLAWKQAL